MPLKIAVGSDHAGFKMKESLIAWLQEKGIENNDFGTYGPEPADYPDYAHTVALAVTNGEFDRGILVCGSGEGVCMAANKHPHIRAAVVWQADVAEISRKHNDANIVCFPARFMSDEVAKESLEVFLLTEFEGGRHAQRTAKIDLG